LSEHNEEPRWPSGRSQPQSRRSAGSKGKPVRADPPCMGPATLNHAVAKHYSTIVAEVWRGVLAPGARPLTSSQTVVHQKL
ncbi:hypothetical protein AVEN_264967-1, partial [Araneus ventricosus]